MFLEEEWARNVPEMYKTVKQMYNLNPSSELNCSSFELLKTKPRGQKSAIRMLPQRNSGVQINCFFLIKTLIYINISLERGSLLYKLNISLKAFATAKNEACVLESLSKFSLLLLCIYLENFSFSSWQASNNICLHLCYRQSTFARCKVWGFGGFFVLFQPSISVNLNISQQEMESGNKADSGLQVVKIKNEAYQRGCIPLTGILLLFSHWCPSLGWILGFIRPLDFQMCLPINLMM